MVTPDAVVSHFEILTELKHYTKGFSCLNTLSVENNRGFMLLLGGEVGSASRRFAFGGAKSSRTKFLGKSNSICERNNGNMSKSRKPKTLAEQIADLDDPAPRGLSCLAL